MASLLSIGNNCCDIYTTTGKMYPGGECANTAAYGAMRGIRSGFLGMFGTDELAEFMKHTLTDLHVDLQRARTFEGENGYTLAHLENGDRVFTGRNYGGVMRYHPFDFDEEDKAYIRTFDCIYTGLHGHAEEELPWLHSLGVPIAFDFSFEEGEEYSSEVAPYVTIALLSLGKKSEEEGIRWMKRIAAYGPLVVIGTMGERGSLLFHKGKILRMGAKRVGKAIDTMGAGDSYFASFLCEVISAAEKQGKNVAEFLGSSQEDSLVEKELLKAMEAGAEFAADICTLSGPYGREGNAPLRYLSEMCK